MPVPAVLAGAVQLSYSTPFSRQLAYEDTGDDDVDFFKRANHLVFYFYLLSGLPCTQEQLCSDISIDSRSLPGLCLTPYILEARQVSSGEGSFNCLAHCPHR
jgi:hypothetical protein